MNTLYIYSFLSSVLAFMGFYNNNTPTLVGAMILSPIMSPLTNLYSSEVKNKGNMISAIITIIKVALFVFSLGVIFGLIKNKYNLYEMESEFMKIRTQPRLIKSEFISTIMVGLGVAYAIKENNKIARTGLTLGIVLIPMLVLSGIYFANYLHYKLNNFKNMNTTHNNTKNINTNLENYHLIHSLKFLSIFIINMGLSGLSFVFTNTFLI